MSDPEIELTIVTMVFEASDVAPLLSVLARYVVLSRTHEGCRNIDLCASVTVPGRVVVVQKWATPDAQRAHFDSPDMVRMAEEVGPLLTGAPSIDLLEPVSAHDLS